MSFVAELVLKILEKVLFYILKWINFEIEKKKDDEKAAKLADDLNHATSREDEIKKAEDLLNGEN